MDQFEMEGIIHFAERVHTLNWE